MPRIVCAILTIISSRLALESMKLYHRRELLLETDLSEYNGRFVQHLA